MATFEKTRPYGDFNFVEKLEIFNPEYNSSIKKNQTEFVILYNNKNGSSKTLEACNSYCFNPKPSGFSNIFKKIDNCKYDVYFLSKSNIDGTSGGYINIKNKAICELQYEKVYYRCSYNFSIVNPKQVIANVLDGTNNIYNKDYFKRIVDKQIKLQIEETLAQNLSIIGLEKFDSRKTIIVEQIEERLNECRLVNLGFKISFNYFVIEEHDDVKVIRETHEIKKYSKRMSGE